MPLLGDIHLQCDLFPPFEEHFSTPEFAQLSARKKFRRVNEVLLELIRNAPAESFLLPAVVDYMQRVQVLNLLHEGYHISLFEFWLNHYAEISDEENRVIRAKIVGKYLPREAYQVYFPVGIGHYFRGSHYVVAHLSPDIDTTIASFWGWIDAFAARVGDGMHLWSLPGGPPVSPIMENFKEVFGTHAFTHLCRTNPSLTLRALDLVTGKNLVKIAPQIQVSALDHGLNEKAVILVDAQGHYLGDWRSTDVEPIRQIIVLFKACMRWFETNAHSQLIDLFTNQAVRSDDVLKAAQAIFEAKIADCEPVQDFSAQQNQDLEALFKHIFKLEAGLQATFSDLNCAFQDLQMAEMDHFQFQLQALRTSDLFDLKGDLIESRPPLFNHLHQVFSSLEKAIHQARDYVERLDVSMQIKTKVLGKTAHYLTIRSDVEDILLKMGNYSYLTVVIPDEKGLYYPLGVVWGHDVRQSPLGTVSLRDFCNLDEVKMAPYLAVISVIDHHKSALHTLSPPTASIGDAQSCNVLVAEMGHELNKQISTAGMDLQSIEKQLHELQPKSGKELRLTARLLQRQIATQTKKEAFIHPQREFLESFFCLQAILDDTDLLTKVTNRDVECVATLLNTLKTLADRQEREIVNLDFIPRDGEFAKKATQVILSNPDMYSLYSKIYAAKEQETEKHLKEAVKGHSSFLWADTKEQNGCSRVGQVKLFIRNRLYFEQQRQELQKVWLQKAVETHKTHPVLDLHVQLVSTIANAEEVFEGRIGQYTHCDEMWIWIPATAQAQDHLASFLSAFQQAKEVKQNTFELYLPLVDLAEMHTVFERNFASIPTQTKGEFPLAVLTYAAGTLNSRKAMITPYLPKII